MKARKQQRINETNKQKESVCMFFWKMLRNLIGIEKRATPHESVAGIIL